MSISGRFKEIIRNISVREMASKKKKKKKKVKSLPETCWLFALVRSRRFLGETFFTLHREEKKGHQMTNT